jgi:hypothetical protein
MSGLRLKRTAMAAVMAVGAATITGGSAVAQGWDPIRNAASGQGTMVCPLDDGATGNLFCFGLRCQAGQPMQWTIFLVGGELPASGEVSVSVDGAAVGSFSFRTTASNGLYAGDAPYSSVRHAAIADALKRGRQGSLTVSGLPRPVTISLRGSTKQIERAFKLCRVPEGAPSQPMAAAPGDAGGSVAGGSVAVGGVRKVALATSGPAADAARRLHAKTFSAHRQMVGSEPDHVAAELVDLPGGRRLLVAEVCGSPHYFGDSACVATIHASTGGDWREVYNTDGVAMWIDTAKLSDGWPAVIVQPSQGVGKKTTWRWRGGKYAAR